MSNALLPETKMSFLWLDRISNLASQIHDTSLPSAKLSFIAIKNLAFGISLSVFKTSVVPDGFLIKYIQAVLFFLVNWVKVIFSPLPNMVEYD